MELPTKQLQSKDTRQGDGGEQILQEEKLLTEMKDNITDNAAESAITYQLIYHSNHMAVNSN